MAPPSRVEVAARGCQESWRLDFAVQYLMQVLTVTAKELASCVDQVGMVTGVGFVNHTWVIPHFGVGPHGH